MNAAPEIVIEAEHTNSNYWRELFYFLARRDVLVRYKQAMIRI